MQPALPTSHPVDSTKQHWRLVLEQVACELRRRDALAVMEADPALTVEATADQYGLEIAE